MDDVCIAFNLADNEQSDAYSHIAVVSLTEQRTTYGSRLNSTMPCKNQIITLSQEKRSFFHFISRLHTHLETALYTMMTLSKQPAVKCSYRHDAILLPEITEWLSKFSTWPQSHMLKSHDFRALILEKKKWNKITTMQQPGGTPFSTTSGCNDKKHGLPSFLQLNQSQCIKFT